MKIGTLLLACLVATPASAAVTALTVEKTTPIAGGYELLEGHFTGAPSGQLNMREGKVARLHEWLAARGQRRGDFYCTAYSDSVNDVPLLEAVDEPIAVDPDPRLAELALARGWRVIELRESAAGGTP